MHHNDQSKIPDLPSIEMKKGSKFKNKIQSCYESHREKIHQFAESISSMNRIDANYSAQAESAKLIGEMALSQIDDIKTKIKSILDDSDREDVTMYLGKCALKNGD